MRLRCRIKRLVLPRQSAGREPCVGDNEGLTQRKPNEPVKPRVVAGVGWGGESILGRGMRIFCIRESSRCSEK